MKINPVYARVRPGRHILKGAVDHAVQPARMHAITAQEFIVPCAPHQPLGFI